MTAFPDDQIETILNGLSKINVDNPKYVLSETRRNLIKKIICIRRDLLKEEFKLK